MKKGFTLIEILVSLFFLSLVMVSFVSVVVLSTRSFRSSRALYLGSKIAEDGIELVVNKRDNNVLCVKPGNCSQLCSWKQGLLYTPGSSCNLRDHDWNVDATKPDQLLAGNWFDDYNPSSLICIKSVSQNKFGVCTTETPITGNYNRKVTVTDVSGLEAVNVKSTVTWTVNGAPASVTLEEMLFGIDGGSGSGSSGDLVGWWKLDENPGQDGTTIADWSGNGNNGTFTTGEGNTNKSANGIIDRALTFDGVNDYVNVPSVNPTSAITVSSWVKSANTTGYSGVWQLVSKYNAYILGTDSTGSKNVCFIIYNSSGWQYGSCYAPTDPQNWHYFTGTYDSATGQKKLYMDGTLRSTTNISGNISADTGPLFFARRECCTDSFSGQLDDVRIYNRALSAEEILYLFSLGVPDTVSPSVPTGLSAAAVSYSQINLSWTDSTDNVGVAGYKVERCQGSGCSSFVQIGAPSDTSFSDMGLISNTTYNYRVRATDAAGNLSGYSSVAGATTQIISCSAVGSNAFFGCYYNSASPGAFTTLAATRADSAINFNWGTGSPDPAITSDLFSARWTGDFNFYAGNNTFTAVSDDGIRFYIDGALIPFDQGNGWKDQTQTTYTATQLMTAGTHRIKVEYYENSAEASAQFSWLQPISGLIGWWKMDENPAIHNSVIADSTGNGNNGILSTGDGSTNKSVAGQIDRALTFDGVNDAVQIPDSNLLDVPQITISAWVRKISNAPSWGMIAARQAGTSYGDNWILFYNSSANDEYRFSAQGGTNLKLYRNGIQISDNTVSSNNDIGQWVHIVGTAEGVIPPETSAVCIGGGANSSTRNCDSEYSNAVIDDVRIYNRALSQTEIQSIYDGGAPPSDPTNLTATPAPSSRINLSWTASTDNFGVASYRLERCQGSGCSSFVQIATPIGTSFSDSGLILGTTYSYRVRAADAAGNLSGYSSVASATVESVAGLVGWWRLDDGIGSLIAADSSGNGNTGVLANGPAWTTAGQIDGALIFDGSDDRVNIGSQATLDNLQQKSISLWVKYPSTGSVDVPALVDKQDGGSSGWQLRLSSVINGSDLRLRFVQNFSGTSGEWSSNASTVPYDSWVNVAVTYDKTIDSNQPTFYVNGSPVAFTAISNPIGTSADDSAVNAYIGDRSASDNSFKGSFDDVRIYNGILSAAEIQTIYDAGAPPSDPTNLVATLASSSQIDLSWTVSTDNVGVAGYKLERCEGSGCTSFTQIATPSGNSYSDTGLSEGITYRYRVRAYDAAGNNSNYSPTASAMSPVPGLVGWWKMDENPAIHNSVIADFSGNGNNGTFSTNNGGTNKSVVGKIGQALNFDGVDDYVNTNYAPNIASTASFSGSFWFKTTSVAIGHEILSSLVAGGTPHIIFAATSGGCTLVNEFRFEFTSDNGSSAGVCSGTSNTYTDGIWHHAVGVLNRSASTISLYIDGKFINSASIASLNGFDLSSNAFFVGARNTGGVGGLNFPGSIDDVRIYNRVLTQPEIQALCDMGTGGCPSGLVARYEFENNTNDTSGNGNNGTFFGGTPSYQTGMVGQALSFDGVANYVQSANTISISSAGYTLSAWAKANAFTNYEGIIDIDLTSANRITLFDYSTGGNRYMFLHGPNASGGVAVPAAINTWYHLAVVSESNSVQKLYANGFLIGTANLGPQTFAGTLRVGKMQNTGTFFNGLIDDVRLYNRALSQPEIQALCNLGIGGCPVAPSLIPQSQMSIASVDSEQLPDYSAAKAIDGNTTSIWHTQYTPTSPPHPHQIIINLGGSYSVVGLKYLPRQDGQNGTIISYNVYVSTDGVTWGSAVAGGSWAADITEKTASFSPKTGSFVKLVANSEWNGNPWTSAAEINIMKQ